MQENQGKQGTIRMQKILLLVSVVLFFVKILAWYLTGSVAILTDALESIVNVIAASIGLYSIILSAKPKDKEHPYGHGKVEFISSAIEGVLISVAGLIIIYEAINNLIHPHDLKQLDYGIILVAITAGINYLTGYYCIRKGKREQSPILMSSGAHLQTDTWSTIGVVLGVSLILLTNYQWIDSVAAIVFAFVIIVTGYKIIRKSISGIMDESDTAIINEIVEVLNKNRQSDWIDIHNMRVINYAGFYHIDCHLTVPYYINVNEAHQIQDVLTEILRRYFKERVEFFIHVDGCLTHQCKICKLEECKVRKHDFENTVQWNYENIIRNSKHEIQDSYINNLN